jgi:hypothetical protein
MAGSKESSEVEEPSRPALPEVPPLRAGIFDDRGKLPRELFKGVASSPRENRTAFPSSLSRDGTRGMALAFAVHQDG